MITRTHTRCNYTQTDSSSDHPGLGVRSTNRKQHLPYLQQSRSQAFQTLIEGLPRLWCSSRQLHQASKDASAAWHSGCVRASGHGECSRCCADAAASSSLMSQGLHLPLLSDTGPDKHLQNPGGGVYETLCLLRTTPHTVRLL